MNSNLIKLLFALCALFVVVLLLELQFLDSAESQLSESKSLDKEIGGQHIKLPEITLSKQAKETYTTIVEKPLFLKGRKPVEENIELNEKKVGGKIDELILDGIYTVDGRMVALMRESRAGKDYLKKSESEEIVGWIIKEIRADSVILESAGNEKTIMLRKPRAKRKPKAKAKAKAIAKAKAKAKIKADNKRRTKVPPKRMKHNPEK